MRQSGLRKLIPALLQRAFYDKLGQKTLPPL